MEDATFGNAFRNKLIYKQKKYKEKSSIKMVM